MFATLTYYTARVASYDEGAFFTLRAVDQVGPVQTIRDYLDLENELRIFEAFDADSETVDHVLQATDDVNPQIYRVAVVAFGSSRRAYMQSIPSELLRFLTIGGYMLSPDLAEDDDGDDRDSFDDVYLQVDTFELAYRLARFARGVN